MSIKKASTAQLPRTLIQSSELPREFKALAGETANIYQTERDGKLAFVVTVNKSFGKVLAKFVLVQI